MDTSIDARTAGILLGLAVVVLLSAAQNGLDLVSLLLAVVVFAILAAGVLVVEP